LKTNSRPAAKAIARYHPGIAKLFLSTFPRSAASPRALRRKALLADPCATRHVNRSGRRATPDVFTDRTRQIVTDWYARDIEIFGVDFTGPARRNTIYGDDTDQDEPPLSRSRKRQRQELLRRCYGFPYINVTASDPLRSCSQRSQRKQ
jgi:hypothetical protein